MNTQSFKTSEAGNSWIVVDAKNKTLGRLATKIAFRLVGKHKPEFTPNADLGDYVIVINAEKIMVTGNKEDKKSYFRHTGYVGGVKMTNLAHMRRTYPERIIENAVKGMLPHNKLGRRMLKHLKVYAGSDHPHSAQTPKTLEI